VRVTQLLDVIAKGDDAEGADILIVYRAEVVEGQLAAADDAAAVSYCGPDAWPELAFTSTRKIIARWKGRG